jgi:hypothetical protein
MDPTFPSLAARLAALIDGQTSALALSTVPSTASSPPSSPSLQSAPPPSPLDAAAQAAGWTLPVLENIARCLVTDLTIVDAQYPGLTRNRVRPLLPENVRSEADPLLRWLDAAHVLAPPASAAEPYRHPRRLLVTGLDDLVQRLVATPYPTGV